MLLAVNVSNLYAVIATVSTSETNRPYSFEVSGSPATYSDLNGCGGASCCWQKRSAPVTCHAAAWRGGRFKPNDWRLVVIPRPRCWLPIGGKGGRVVLRMRSVAQRRDAGQRPNRTHLPISSWLHIPIRQLAAPGAAKKSKK